MMFKIETSSDNSKRIFRLSGRVQADQLEELQGFLGSATTVAVLDLQEVKLVDREVVAFLRHREAQGVELRNCPPYIREWILAEHARMTNHKTE